MAIDFPSSPVLGQTVTSGGVTWTWDGAKWVAQGTGAGVYLPLAGGTMTGDLILNRDAQVALGAVAKEQVDAVQTQVNARGAGDNRIINGDMRVDQRNNGVVTAWVGGIYVIDRWQFQGSQTGKVSGGRSNAIVGPAGFPYYLGASSQSSYTVLAGDYFYIGQSIEADFVSDFAWGTASAQPVTLSWWVQSTLTGLFSGAINNNGSTRSYPFTFSIPTANVWTKIVVTIPGDTAGTWTLSGNGAGLNIHFDLGAGATFRGPAGAWASANYTSAVGAVSLVGTNNAAFFVTGVKLEIGSVATPFNRQSLAKSQADCERYFRWLAFNMYWNAAAGSAVQQQGVVFSAMRASPTISPNSADPNTTQNVANQSANTWAVLTPYSAVMQLTATAAGACYLLGYRASASAEL